MVVDACYNKSYGLPLDHIGPGTFVRTYIDLCRPKFAVADIERSACPQSIVAVTDTVLPIMLCPFL